MRTIAVMKLLSGWELSTVYQFCGIWERKPPNLIKPLSSNVNGHHISIFQGSHRLKWKEHIKEYFETQDVLPSAINSLCDNTNSFRASLVAQMVKKISQSLGQEGPLEKEMATHSSIHAWRIPWTEEPGGIQSVRSQRVGHGWPRIFQGSQKT